MNINIKFWDCKCGKSNVPQKKVCKCGRERADFELQTSTGAVKLSEIDNTDNENLKKNKQKEYDKKQRKINKELQPPQEGSLLQSCIKFKDKR